MFFYNVKKVFLIYILIFISNALYADVIFNDPSGDTLSSEYEKYSRNDFINIDKPDIYKKKYMAALLFLRGDKEFRIDKNCHKSISLLEETSSENIMDSKYMLAQVYYHGICVDADLNKAKEFLHESAEGGYILAERMLGQAYFGEDMKGIYARDMEKAIFWLKKAANMGDQEAAGSLSYIYQDGVGGIKKDEVKAFKWLYAYSHSEKFFSGNGAGFYKLAGFYEIGYGTTKDLVQAYKYYTLSGNAGAKGKHRVAEQMTPEQIQEGQRLANEWMQKHHAYVPNY